MFTVYAIDSRYPSTGWSISGTIDVDYVRVNVTPAAKIEEIAMGMTRTLMYTNRKYHSVDLLILAAHGNSGYLQLGEGLTAEKAKQFKALAPWLKRDLYADGMRLHGCGVASSTNIVGPGSTITAPICVPGTTTPGFDGNGYKLLKALAVAIGRNVTAGVDCQYTDEGWKFEGPTVTVNPTGGWGLKT
ncbi:hypothetical protein ACYOEI_03170 [Singulisphaera rosea]